MSNLHRKKQPIESIEWPIPMVGPRKHTRRWRQDTSFLLNLVMTVRPQLQINCDLLKNLQFNLLKNENIGFNI